MRFLACVLLAAAAAAGCGESAAAPTIPPDAGRDASIPPDGGVDPDGSVGDGGADGGMLDGGMDGGVPDGGDPDAGGSWCETSALCPTCPAQDALCDPTDPGSCPIGEVCLSTGCEDLSRCFVTGGGRCLQDEDCGNRAYRCDPTIFRCLRIEPGCDDSNDCVAGFACEDGHCADRRVPCRDGLDCPHGFTCFFASPDQQFCRRITRPCFDNLDCLVLGVPCGDADGDGKRECMPSLMPDMGTPVSCDNAQCSDPTPVCQSTVQGTRAQCGQFGLCASSDDCAEGFDCLDLWGDGRNECVLRGGSCVDSRECALQNVCASPRSDEAPTCIGEAGM